MKLYHLLATCVFVAILCSTTGAAPARIVIVGDSITGLSRNAHDGFANQMDAALAAVAPDSGIEIVSLGGSGQSVESWLGVEKQSRTDSSYLDIKGIEVKTTLDQHADVLVVMLGMNNVLAPYTQNTEVSLDRWIAHYRELIVALSERTTPTRLALCSITPCTEDPKSPKNALIDAMNERIRGLAKTEGADYFKTSETVWETLQKGRARKPDFHVTRDFVHPNAAGHIGIAMAMLNGLGRQDAASWLEKERLQPLLKAASEAAEGLSWSVDSIQSLANGLFTFQISYDWTNAGSEDAPQVELNVPEGWRVNPLSQIGTAGKFTVIGLPDHRVNVLKLEGHAGADVRRSEITLPAPWLVAAKLPLPYWSGEGFNTEKSRTPIDAVIEAGEDFTAPIDVGKSLILTWVPVFASFNYTGLDDPDSVDFAAVTHAENFESGYAARQIHSDIARHVLLEIGTRKFAGDTYMHVWLNGTLCYDGKLMTTNAPARLEKGWNTLVFKASHRTWQWQASVGIRGIDNDKLDDLRYGLPGAKK